MKVAGFGILTIVHAILAVFLIVELGMVSYLVDAGLNWAYGGSPTAFLVFASVWSILVLVYIAIAPAYFPKFHIPLVSFILQGITMLFWFAGATALAARIGVPECGGARVCQTAQASVAFGYFIWAGFLGLFILEAIAFWKGRSSVTQPDKV